MEKMNGKSLDLVSENIEQLKALFPEAVTEGKIDFEVLKALLGEEIEKRETYYKFTWNGKEEARAYARIPSMGTLRPCIAESLGKDGTAGKFDSENLYIEGDNLEVLKLLQGPYHKKVKMIYIDPPYNTGKDFVYPDNYQDSLVNYKSLTGQSDSEGKSTRANPETSGRFHTDWLNMMYPRLILARNLLSDDGVIFISIADDEVANLRKICDDVFGEENFIINICHHARASISNDKIMSENHNHILLYAKELKNIFNKRNKFGLNPDLSGFNLSDSRGNYKLVPVDGPGGAAKGNPYYEFQGITGYWRFSKETMQRMFDDGKIVVTSNNLQQKYYLDEAKESRSTDNSWWDEKFYTSSATMELKKLMGGDCFTNPKPVELIRKMLQLWIRNDNDVVMDFFSGSATLAHAVFLQNASDSISRYFICIQLPELTYDLENGKENPKKEAKEAYALGYKNICEIGKERIRRAAKKICDENPLTTQNQDLGFKVFKLDTSNFIPWNPEPEKIELFMRNTVENILADRSRQDLLYEVLLKCNLPLTLPIDEKKFGENTVYVVGAGVLAICLDTEIPQTIADEIVKLRNEYAPIVPMQVVFCDNGFTDVAKTNALQILKQAGFEEKSIQSI